MEEAENGVSKLSLSPTRSPSSEQRQNPSTSPPLPRVPSWLILDRIVHRSSRRRCGAVPDDATGSALAHDLFDRPVRASLRIADPPSVSRLYLHLPGRPPIKRHFEEPKAIAAHRNSILFRLTVPFDDSSWWHDTVSFPDDYFVYSCRSSSSLQPSLTRLPTCFHGGTTCPDLDKLYEPHRRQQQRAMFPEEIGILSHDDDDDGMSFTSFTVAQLNFSGPDEFEICVLHRPPLAPSTSMEWSCKKVQKPRNMKASAYTWRTDIVVAIGRRCLCWVDNYQGLLLVDVVDFLADSKSNPDHHQQWLRYIPLPSKALKSRRLYKDFGSLDPLRRVSVTDSGVIKLVCILTKRPPSPYPFTIRTWTLDDVEEGKWTMDVENTMGAEEFFSVLGTAGHSCHPPRVQPSFPLVSLVDPDITCFLMNNEDRSLFWMIEINMRNKKVQSCALYISEEEEEDGYPPKRGIRNKFSGHQFIPSKFSSYLPEDAITSRELSEKMQKSKESSVMQSGLEAQLK